jgi:hypothetical protein
MLLYLSEWVVKAVQTEFHRQGSGTPYNIFDEDQSRVVQSWLKILQRVHEPRGEPCCCWFVHIPSVETKDMSGFGKLSYQSLDSLSF